MSGGESDPFQAARLRARVLDGWAASPSRFREDANAEEDYALGGYRDRVVVELAQNAADAAARAGVPGRLRLTLRDGILVAANTGAPLDAAGVEALSTLRASSKRGHETGAGAGPDAEAEAAREAVGRFGVGFAAVVAVTDAPRIRSAGRTVSWSRERTRELAAAIPALSGELAARSGHVPVLRLPFDDTGGGATGSGAGDRSATGWGATDSSPTDSCATDWGTADGGAGDSSPTNWGTAGSGIEHAGDAGGGEEPFVTAVELPLRDAAAVGLVSRLLEQTGPALLLALPALDEVVIEVQGTTRVLTAEHHGDRSTVSVDGVPSEWRASAAGGELDPALLAGRPAEERGRTSWSVRWAVPVTSDGAPAGRLPNGVDAVLYAPTPTDEPLGRPALLLASFPLSPDRRHVAPGPLSDFLIERAAQAYAGLLSELVPGPGLLNLVPGPAGRGELDAQLSRAIVSRLSDAPFLPAATPGGGRVRPRDAILLDTALLDSAPLDPVPQDTGLLDAGSLDPGSLGPGSLGPGLLGPGRSDIGMFDRSPGSPRLSDWLAPVLPNLVTGPARHPAWAVLGVRRMPLAELADLIAALDREPAWWRGLYAALAGVPADELSELGALAVPLADGRQARGPRGLLLPGPGLADPGRLAVLGLRVVHPEAVHPLLARLGAVEATARGVLEDPATRTAVATSYDKAAEAYYDDDSPERVADAVLGLAAATGAEPGDYPWLAELALPGEDGDWYPAGELLLPDSPLAGLVAEDAPFSTVSPGFARRHGAQALAAAGLLSTFGLLRAQDVALDDSAADLELDGAAGWAADMGARLRSAGGGDGDQLPALPAVAAEVAAVRDLDLVDPRRWPQALELLTRPPLRTALTEPTRVLLPDGRHADVPSYTAWWLRRNLVLGGRRPGDLRVPGSDPLLAGLYEEIQAHPAEDQALARVLGDPVIARALGVRDSLAALLAEPGGADELLGRLADPGRAVSRPQLQALWSALAASGLTQDDITPPDRVRAVQGEKLTVADAADVLILDSPDLWPLVADQPLVTAPAQHAARLADLLDLPLASEELPGAVESAGERRPVPDVVRDVLPGAPASYQEHDRLIVDGADVPWRYTGGELHVATADGLADGLAWAAGRWQARHTLAALLLSPDEAPRLLAEADLDPLA